MTTVNVDHRQRTALQLALLEGDFANARRLIVEHRNNFAYLDNRDEHGFTAMHYAAEHRNAELIRFLHAHGSRSMSARSNAGRKPSYFARGDARCEEALRDCDSDVSESEMDSDDDNDDYHVEERRWTFDCNALCGVY